MRRGADAPADDLAGKGVDDEGDVDEALPGGDMGEIADPEHVGSGRPNLPVHLIQGAWRLLVRDRRPVRLAADHALNIHVLRQPRDRAAGDVDPLAAQLVPDLADAKDTPVVLENAPDLEPQRRDPARTIRPPANRPASPDDRGRWTRRSAAPRRSYRFKSLPHH